MSSNLPDGVSFGPHASLALALVGAARPNVGWMAHGVEAAAQDRPIRPRAKSVGPLPGDETTERTPAGPYFPALP